MTLSHIAGALVASTAAVAILCAESIADAACAVIPTWGFAVGGIAVACGLTAYAWRWLGCLCK